MLKRQSDGSNNATNSASSKLQRKSEILEFANVAIILQCQGTVREKNLFGELLVLVLGGVENTVDGEVDVLETDELFVEGGRANERHVLVSDRVVLAGSNNRDGVGIFEPVARDVELSVAEGRDAFRNDDEILEVNVDGLGSFAEG